MRLWLVRTGIERMNVNYEIPDDLHRALKMTAAAEGITLKLLIIRLLDVGLDALRNGAEIEWERSV